MDKQVIKDRESFCWFNKKYVYDTVNGSYHGKAYVFYLNNVISELDTYSTNNNHGVKIVFDYWQYSIMFNPRG